MLFRALSKHSTSETVIIENTKGHWRKIRHKGFLLHAKGNISRADLGRLLKSIEKNNGLFTLQVLTNWLNSLSANFGLIGLFSGKKFAAADWVGSTPIFYTLQPTQVIISNNAPLLANTIGQPISQNIDQNAWLAFEASGYTIGSSTLHKNIKRLKPGQVLMSGTDGVLLGRYHRYEPWNYTEKCEKKLINSLSDITLEVFRNHVERANGRQIAIPISAGFDSRLVASVLKYIGVKNVICFSYGQAGNNDAVTGKAVADRLGYPWHFVLTNSKIQEQLFASNEHVEYMQYADNYSSVPFRQDIVPIRELLKKGILQQDAILINGNSGDFTSGGHIPNIFFEDQISGEFNDNTIVNEVIKKHFSLWTQHSKFDLNEHIRSQLFAELKEEGLADSKPEDRYAIFEFLEFTNRQSKFVINGQRIYEFYNLDWELPLWDRELLDFWERVPLSLKKNQLLYKTMLLKNNWANVWEDIPLNKKNIRPVWIALLRNLLKIVFAPSGRKQWHNFERRYLNYHTDLVGNYAIYPYRHIATSEKIGRNAVSWHTAHYLDSISETSVR
ncbi:asparagine synthase C-terminal domain-containing protein [Alphaproteobacteria bacterium]|nr:asparagine synthase C-terminal domain-containing protein [Alphaproteobacteria bacterium]